MKTPMMVQLSRHSWTGYTADQWFPVLSHPYKFVATPHLCPLEQFDTAYNLLF